MGLVECWDDDSDLEDIASLNVRDSLTGRESLGMSMVQEDLAVGQEEEEEENWHEFDLDADESAANVMRKAAKAGIPIAADTPASALVGGVIRKLDGSRKDRSMQDMEDWDEDLELPETFARPKLPSRSVAPADLAVTFKSPTLSQGTFGRLEDFDDDFDIPTGQSMMDIIHSRKVPDAQSDKLQLEGDEWGETSLGIRHGGTRRSSHSQSGRLSTLSFGSNLSPNASATTVDSDDEGLDGLELPPSLNFQKLLDQRKMARSVPMGFSDTKAAAGAARDDFFNDLEIGEGDVFENAGHTVNKNVKHNSTARQKSPQKKTAASLFFNSKSGTTRIPRPILTHSQSSSSGIHAQQRTPPAAPTLQNRNGSNFHNVPIPPTPGRNFSRDRAVSKKGSMMSLRSESGARGLSAKKSMPALRSHAMSSAPPPPPRPVTSHSRTSIPHTTESANTGTSKRPTHEHNLRTRPSIRNFAEQTVASAAKSVAQTLRTREASTPKTLTRPLRNKYQWNGDELSMMDDLPISAQREKKYEVSPVGRGAPRTRAHAEAGHGTPPSPTKTTSTPDLSRFMRDTAASRIAREQRLQSRREAKKDVQPDQTPRRRKGQRRPHLIKPLGRQSKSTKSVLGMTYNPSLYCWEGNEGEMKNFDNIALTPPRPALISNVLGVQDAKIVGGMVFDPVRMRWHRFDPQQEEDDPFEGVEDLEEDMSVHSRSRRGEFVVGDEFDIGPAFIKEQMQEEQRWRNMVHGWIDPEFVSRRDRYWDLRRMVQRIPH